MDSEEKHATWIEDIYEKVGTLYSGIDNIISQESMQYAETQFLTAGVNVKQFTENQILAAGANVKQFAEDKFSTTGSHFRQFCSDFVQEVFSDFLKDSFIEKSQSEDTEKCDSSCEILKKQDDKCHKDEVSKSNDGGVSASRLSTVGKEMILELNHTKVNVIPSEISQADMFKKNDVGVTTLICGVDESHDGGIEDQIDLQSLKLVLSQPSDSSSKAERNAESEPSVLDNLICHHNATMSAGLDESRILENEDHSIETCSGFVEADDSLAFSLLDGPDTRETGLNGTETLDNSMTMDHYCYPMVSSNKICSASHFLVEQGKFENEWEFMEMVGYEDHPVESDEPQGMRPKKSLQPKEPKYKNDCESCESEWEIV